jgi:hypothetical protein
LPLNLGTKPFSHITVFLLPGITLPPNTAAAVYISLPPAALQQQQDGSQQQPNFKFLGGIGEGKESAVFKVSGLLATGGGGGGEIDMDAPEPSVQASSTLSSLTLGISLESASSVSSQMAVLQSQSSKNTSTSLVLSRPPNPQGKPDTLVLAQRIIKNAFNFLASFSGNVNGGVEVVPLKAFEEWWRKFEGRVRSDPGFLERATDGD